MALGNYTVFRPKQITAVKFGSTAWTSADMADATKALDTTFTTNNATALIDLVGAADSVSPTKSAAFGKSYKESGNERTESAENLLGADSVGSQNQEIAINPNSPTTVEFTCVYRNTSPAAIFNDSTKACLLSFDNSESSGTGVLNIAYNNIRVLHVGSLEMNTEGLMQQTVKFACRGGTAGTAIAVTQSSPAETWTRIRMGLDRAEEIRLT